MAQFVRQAVKMMSLFKKVALQRRKEFSGDLDLCPVDRAALEGWCGEWGGAESRT